MQEQDVVLKLNDHDHEIGSLKYRVKACEDNQKVQTGLIRTVDKLADNMLNMLDEQKQQGERLARLERVPSEDYKYYKRVIVGCLLTGVVGAIFGAILALVIK